MVTILQREANMIKINQAHGRKLWQGTWKTLVCVNSGLELVGSDSDDLVPLRWLQVEGPGCDVESGAGAVKHAVSCAVTDADELHNACVGDARAAAWARGPGVNVRTTLIQLRG